MRAASERNVTPGIRLRRSAVRDCATIPWMSFEPQHALPMGCPRRYPEITDSSVLPMVRVSALSRLVLRRWRRRVFSGAGAGGASRDVTNSETQFVIIKPPFVLPATPLTDLGSRGNSCYSLTAYPRLPSATAPQFRRTTRK